MASDVLGDILGEIPFHFATLKFAHEKMRAIDTPERQRQANRIAQRHNKGLRLRQMLRELRHDLNRPGFIERNDARMQGLAEDLGTMELGGTNEVGVRT